MKNALTIAFGAFCIAGFAQSTIQLKNIGTNAVLAANATVSVTTASETNFKVNFDVKNTSGSTQTYNAKRYDITLNTGAVAYFCFAGNCYGDQTLISPNALTLTAGQSASEIAGAYNILTADLDEGTIPGNSLVKYTFINTVNASDSIQVSIQYNGPSILTGIASISHDVKSTFNVYPNPSLDGNVTLDASIKYSKIQVINAVGQVVSLYKGSDVEGQRTRLNLSSLVAGVYYVQIYTLNGVGTEKLIISK